MSASRDAQVRLYDLDRPRQVEIRWCLPALLAGALAGVGLYRRLGAQDYRRLVFSLLLAMALLLLWRALAGL